MVYVQSDLSIRSVSVNPICLYQYDLSTIVQYVLGVGGNKLDETLPIREFCLWFVCGLSIFMVLTMVILCWTGAGAGAMVLDGTRLVLALKPLPQLIQLHLRQPHYIL